MTRPSIESAADDAPSVDLAQPSPIGPIRELIGQIALWLRDHQVLLIVPLVGAALTPAKALLIQSHWSQAVSHGRLIGAWALLNPAIPIGAVLIALAVSLDKVADWFEKRAAVLVAIDLTDQRRAAEDKASAAVSNLAHLLAAAIRAAIHRGEAHATLVEELKYTLTQQAANAVGDGTRATYYTLTLDEHGQRILGDPVHATNFPRTDEPTRAFVEHDQPGHSIWSVMDAADGEPRVRHFPEQVDDLDWSRKEYRTFISIPVKTAGTQFGMLSVNNKTDGSIARTEKFVFLAMARVFALVLASDLESKNWLTTLGADDSRES